MRILSKLLTFFIGGVVLALVLSFLIDRITGVYLNKIGYYKAITPSVTEIYTTKEYSIVATISAQGIRNSFVAPKSKDTYRILAVGDSFTYGWGVSLDQSWVKQLEHKLRSQGKKVEIINAGGPGADTSTDIRLCRAYADQFDVDAVIVGFYATDDLYQNGAGMLYQEMNKNYPAILWPNLVTISNPLIFDSWHQTAKPGDKIYFNRIWANYSERYFSKHPDSLLHLNPQIRLDVLEGKINSNLVTLAADEPEYLIKMLDTEYFNYAIKATDTILNKMKKSCIGSRKGYVVFLPSDELVSKDYFQYRVGTGYKVDPKLLQFDPDPDLADITRKAGLTYISLLKNFRKDGCPGCYYNWDMHLTSKGNERVADELLNKL